MSNRAGYPTTVATRSPSPLDCQPAVYPTLRSFECGIRTCVRYCAGLACAAGSAAAASPSSLELIRRENSRHTRPPKSSSSVNTAGTKMSESAVETTRPPITAIAIGERKAPTAPNDSDEGNNQATIDIIG